MVVSDAIHNIMGGIENTGDVRLHNHRRKLKQRFDIVKKLGQGTYGKVQLGINKETGQEVAIKTIRKCKIETEADLIRIRREIQIMSSVRHPNIIHIYEVFENREKMVLVMEYAAGGELYDYLSERKVLTEDEARRIFRQIATAVYYCHKHNICHRDLKLENILLDEVGNAKIADFGLSNVFSYSSLLSTFCGSPLYASPEIVKGTPYQGPEVDCWSLGVLLYTLVYGAMPFDGSNFKRLVKQISQGDYFEPKTPSPASPLISEMLNVNPARRATVQAICSHWWINETYSVMCLDVAEELANLTPVRLDLLLSLSAPPVSAEKIVVDNDQVAGSAEVNGALERPIRSQSLGSIPPQSSVSSTVPLTLPEAKESLVQDDKKTTKVRKKERSQSKTRKKERSRSRSRKSESREREDATAEKPTKQAKEEGEKTSAPLVNSETQVITKPAPVAASSTQVITPKSEEPVAEPAAATTPAAEKETPPSPKEELHEAKPKQIERRRSKVFEVAEKFNAANEKPTTTKKSSPPPKKIILPGINVDGARKEFERRSSLVAAASSGSGSGGSGISPPKRQPSLSQSIPADESFPLASTVALNKLVESAFKDELPLEGKTPAATAAVTPPREVTKPTAAGKPEPSPEKVKPTPKAVSNVVSESNSKAATLPRRKTSRAEIQLVAPQFPPDNFKTEVEHFVNKPTVNHKTEIVFPVSAPLPPKPLTKQENQSKEHIIPIQMEPEVPRKVTSPPPMWSASKSSIPRTSSSSLSRQSTVESDSGSTISTGEPIRKSPREVIIPIAVEGGGYVTPSEDTLTRMSSTTNVEDESSRNGSRCFTLRSTKRRQPEPSQSAQLDTADSLSSDEDDNFQLLTAENLFSTLLSRVRSLTQRLNNDEMRRSSAFPRSLFAQHSSLFDNLPSRRLVETRSFSRPESAPWRRGFSSNDQTPRREDSIKKRYSTIMDENSNPITATTATGFNLPETESKFAKSKLTKEDVKMNGNANNEPITAAKKHLDNGVKETEEDKNAASVVLTRRGSRFRRDFSKPTTIETPSPRETPTAPHNRKLSIEEEFDKFFSKYKKPSTSTAPVVADKKDVSDESSLKSKPPRKSRFLRPDFYDTPPEESKYVIKNEKVRAFRERSLSRQRELARNRSTDSFAAGSTLNGSSSGGGLNEYVRSKTCNLSDKMESTLKRESYRRTISDDPDKLKALGTEPVSAEEDSAAKLYTSDLSKRKSVILQSELENEIRKTKNISSKLSGLLEALNDSESRYEKKLERLYGMKPSTKPVENGGASPAAEVEEAPVPPDEDRYEKRKFAYFKRLQNSSEEKETLPSQPLPPTKTTEESIVETPSELKVSTSGASTGSFENDTSSLTTPPEDGDSDGCSVISDGTDAQYLDNVNDRIRRRSFYSRFNIYKQKSTSNASKSSKPPVSYSRSLSADYRQRSPSFSKPPV